MKKRIMISFSNGHSFEFMTASGALAFDGRGWAWEWPLRWVGLLDPALFTIVTKTLTRTPRKGNLRWSHPWSVVKKTEPEGIVNAIGLTNKGIDWWISEIAPTIPQDYKIVVSIEADNIDTTAGMLRMLETKRIVGVELNLSCPNSVSKDSQTTEKIVSICRAAEKLSKFPLIAKLSYTHDYLAIAQKLDPKKIQAIAINSIPWKAIFADKPSPLSRFGGGGISGKIIQPYSWKMVKEIAQSTSIPVIGPSVWDYGDVRKIFDCGAKAVSFGSIFVRHPWRPTEFVKRWKREGRSRSLS
jgi:dihydroorotate dehydrogenase (NAD+) catalytic subunit